MIDSVLWPIRQTNMAVKTHEIFKTFYLSGLSRGDGPTYHFNSMFRCTLASMCAQDNNLQSQTNFDPNNNDFPSSKSPWQIINLNKTHLHFINIFNQFFFTYSKKFIS